MATVHRVAHIRLCLHKQSLYYTLNTWTEKTEVELLLNYSNFQMF